LSEAKGSKAGSGRRSSASATAKLILCGEHAVVYGRPAIALPLDSIRANVEISAGRAGRGIAINARDLRRRWRVADKPNNPLSQLIMSMLAHLAALQPICPPAPLPDLKISISSAIPIASGMGSGAAVATALVRALAAHLGHHLPPAEVSALVYASEQRYHGTPSGIDNSVIAYEQPIWFARQPTKDERRKTKDASPDSSFALRPSSETPIAPLIEPVVVASPLALLIGDTGVRSATRLPVGEVRRRWQADPAPYEALFDQIGALVARARAALAQGDTYALGVLLNHNHELLQQIGVSSPELDALVVAAQAEGALGAKLSGAGWGGVMLALVTAQASEQVAAALAAAGARRVLATTVLPHLA
jgi:mevalonate kinase